MPVYIRFIGSRAILSGPAGGVVSTMLCLPNYNTVVKAWVNHMLTKQKLLPLKCTHILSI